MNKFELPPPVKLIYALLHGEGAPIEECLRDLKARHGEIDFLSDRMPFEYTDYYYTEMGRPLYRAVASFRDLVAAEDLREIKLYAGELERKYAAADGSRTVNLDPGYLTGAAFILSSSKNYAHRIHLGDGVFAQQELLFEKKRIRTLDWTYPDYRSFEYQEILRRIRSGYLRQLRIGEESSG